MKTRFSILGILIFSATSLMATTKYEGVIKLHIDATDVSHKIFRVKEVIPVRPGAFSMQLPKWHPGNHAPTGPIAQIAGLVIKAKGQTISWTRDPIDVYVFHVNVPQGAAEIEIEFQSITPITGSEGRIVMTPAMFNLQWNVAALYPVGYASADVTVKADLTVPNGWQAFCALDLENKKSDTFFYKPISFEHLVDSPVFAGLHSRTFELDSNPQSPVRLNVVADDPRFLEINPDQMQAHKNLIMQADRLFQSRHYDRYDFLLALSEDLSGIGLEHHRSSENAVKTNYFTKWDPKLGVFELLAHEYTHSWNGKFRRPADLWTPHFNTPMQDSLLWVYEGQTHYWGHVLNSRAGLYSTQSALDVLALRVANFTENKPGMSWRNLADTTNEPIIGYRASKPYLSWQLGVEYYQGGQLLWLEADALIRGSSGGKKSLDDFASTFFGADNGTWTTPKLYNFDDVVATLNQILPYDWRTFLRDRLDGRTPLINGVKTAGWKLVFKEEPNAMQKFNDAEAKQTDFTYSIGVILDKDNKVRDVRWDSPAFNAGIATGTTIVAVNDFAVNTERLEYAIKESQLTKAPLRLLIKNFDVFKPIEIRYTGGLRYPHLERIEGVPDLLTSILSPRP